MSFGKEPTKLKSGHLLFLLKASINTDCSERDRSE